MGTTFSNSDDLIDSRDVIARIEELEGEREALADAMNEAHGELQEIARSTSDARLDADEDTREAAESEYDAALEAYNSAADAMEEWNNGEGAEELKALKALADEAEGYAADWRHGETLIRDSYFERYAQELAEETGAIDRKAGWPNNFIDWEAAADALKMDYTSVDFGGVDYWVRS
jgi:hypothetical protein